MVQCLSPGSVPDQWGTLKGLHCPITLITGTLDSKYDRVAIKIVQHSKKAVHYSLPGLGHNAHTEDPKVFSRQLQTILD